MRSTRESAKVRQAAVTLTWCGPASKSHQSLPVSHAAPLQKIFHENSSTIKISRSHPANRHTDKQTDKRRLKQYPLGGGNNSTQRVNYVAVVSRQCCYAWSVLSATGQQRWEYAHTANNAFCPSWGYTLLQ